MAQRKRKRKGGKRKQGERQRKRRKEHAITVENQDISSRTVGRKEVAKRRKVKEDQTIDKHRTATDHLVVKEEDTKERIKAKQKERSSKEPVYDVAPMVIADKTVGRLWRQIFGQMTRRRCRNKILEDSKKHKWE